MDPTPCRHTAMTANDNLPGDGEKTAVSAGENSEDVPDRDLSTFGELDGDVEELREAPAETVAEGLREDLDAVREAAEAVEDALTNGSEDLSDDTIEELWDAAATLTGWPRDVLVHRTETAEEDHA